MLFSRYAEQAIGVYSECDANARCASGHGRNAAQFKAGQTAAIDHQVALALQHVQRQCGLTVLVGGEVLRHGRGNGLVARNDALDQTAHGLNDKRQWDHIKQQQVASRVVAGQLIGLDGSAQGHHFIRV